MEIRRTTAYKDWLVRLRDPQARARVLHRVDRLQQGNPGQTRGVGAGVVEMKIDYGPGYRVYFIQRGTTVILLLCGGDKSTQSADVQRAKTLAAQHEES